MILIIPPFHFLGSGLEQRFLTCGQQMTFVSIAYNSASQNLLLIQIPCRLHSFKVIELCHLTIQYSSHLSYVSITI